MPIWFTIVTFVALMLSVVLGCLAYILISFAKSSHLLAARIGQQPLRALMVRKRTPSRRRAVALSMRWARIAVGRPVLSLPMVRH